MSEQEAVNGPLATGTRLRGKDSRAATLLALEVVGNGLSTVVRDRLFAGCQALLESRLGRLERLMDGGEGGGGIVVVVHQPMLVIATLGQFVHHESHLLQRCPAWLEITYQAIAGFDEPAIEAEGGGTGRAVARVAAVPGFRRSQQLAGFLNDQQIDGCRGRIRLGVVLAWRDRGPLASRRLTRVWSHRSSRCTSAKLVDASLL